MTRVHVSAHVGGSDSERSRAAMILVARSSSLTVLAPASLSSRRGAAVPGGRPRMVSD